MSRPRRPLLLRFREKVGPPDANGCWPWLGYKEKAGYGKIALGGGQGKCAMAHRVSFELFVGPIPEGLTIDHLCRNTSCVNPAHLEPVTHRVNILRGEGLAAKNAVKTRCPQGHPYDAANTYVYRGLRSCRACARVRTATWQRKQRKAAA